MNTSGRIGEHRSLAVFAILALLVLVLPLLMGNRTAETLALSGLVLVSGALLLAVAGWLIPIPGHRMPPLPASWQVFALVITAMVVLQILPVPLLARMFGAYPEALWSGELVPGQWSPEPERNVARLGDVHRAGGGRLGRGIPAHRTPRAAVAGHRHRGAVPGAVRIDLARRKQRDDLRHLGAQHARFCPRQLFQPQPVRRLPGADLADDGGDLVASLDAGHQAPAVRAAGGRKRDLRRHRRCRAARFSVAPGQCRRCRRHAGALVLWTRYRSRLSRVAIWPIYLTAFGALIAATWYGLTPLAERLAVTSVEEGRFEVYALMLSELKPQWWLTGVGLGGFEAVFRQVQPADMSGWYDYAHNDLLQWLLEMGIIGAALLGAVGVALWRHARLARETIPLYAGLTAQALVALGDFSWHIPATQVVLAVYLGVLLKPNDPPDDQRTRRKPRETRDQISGQEVKLTPV